MDVSRKRQLSELDPAVIHALHIFDGHDSKLTKDAFHTIYPIV